jgi:hypothetical protein
MARAPFGAGLYPHCAFSRRPMKGRRSAVIFRPNNKGDRTERDGSRAPDALPRAGIAQKLMRLG